MVPPRRSRGTIRRIHTTHGQKQDGPSPSSDPMSPTNRATVGHMGGR